MAQYNVEKGLGAYIIEYADRGSLLSRQPGVFFDVIAASSIAVRVCATEGHVASIQKHFEVGNPASIPDPQDLLMAGLVRK